MCIRDSDTLWTWLHISSTNQAKPQVNTAVSPQTARNFGLDPGLWSRLPLIGGSSKASLYEAKRQGAHRFVGSAHSVSQWRTCGRSDPARILEADASETPSSR